MTIDTFFPFSFYLVGALIERPAEKLLIFRFLSAKRFLLPDIFYKIGTFSRALNELPYEIGRPVCAGTVLRITEKKVIMDGIGKTQTKPADRIRL